MAIIMLAVCCINSAYAQREVVFTVPDEPGLVHADLYGDGRHGVVLAHGGQLNKESWKKQANVLAKKGFVVLAIRFRGDSFNPDGSPSSEGELSDNADDVLAAVSYLHQLGVESVFVVGASLGGDAAGEANVKSRAGDIVGTVLLSSSGGPSPEKLKGLKLFIVARGDQSSSGPRLPEILDHYTKAHAPKKLVVLDGDAHGQFLFDGVQGPRVLKEILRFLPATPKKIAKPLGVPLKQDHACLSGVRPGAIGWAIA